MARSVSKDAKLYVTIAAQIRDWIESGALNPGDRLPPLAVLAEQFHCSRATVREALGALRGQGLVEFRHGDGTYVRTANIEVWMEPLDAALLLAAGEVVQLLELITAVLAGVAAVAARRHTEQTLAALAQALFQLECAVPGAEEAVSAELAFYLVLAECTDNVLMVNVMRVLQEAFRSHLRLVHQRDAASVATCRKLYDAVRARDAVTARDIVCQYGEYLLERLARRE